MQSLVHAYKFAADRHRTQRRKDDPETPYINHPASVAAHLAEAGVVAPLPLIVAVLHDTVEDTSATLADVQAAFGADVARAVGEVSDNRDLPKVERKRRQVETAAGKSEAARLVKLADKLDNLLSMQKSVPRGWDAQRVRGYVVWALAVVQQLRGTNAALEDRLEAVFSDFGLSLSTAPEAYAAELEAYYASLQ